MVKPIVQVGAVVIVGESGSAEQKNENQSYHFSLRHFHHSLTPTAIDNIPATIRNAVRKLSQWVKVIASAANARAK